MNFKMNRVRRKVLRVRKEFRKVKILLNKQFSEFQ